MAVQESMAEVSPRMPWCTPDYDIATAISWIKTVTASGPRPKLVDYVILADGKFAGGCGLSHVNYLDGVVNLGYWVRTSMCGQGITSAGAREVVQCTFAETALNHVEIIAAIENVSSQRVAVKLGARRDAVLRKRIIVGGQPTDAVLFSIVRAD